MENGSANHPRYRAAKRLLEGSERLAGIFRRQAGGFQHHGLLAPPLLDGVVAPFLRKLAEELIAVRPDPAAPWARAGGVLRVAPEGGEEQLRTELAFLRELLHDVIEPLEGGAADEETLDFVHAALDVLHEGVLDEQARLFGERPRFAAPRFTGIVLVAYGGPRRGAEARPHGEPPFEPAAT